jgi:hypothetical protein
VALWGPARARHGDTPWQSPCRNRARNGDFSCAADGENLTV